MKIGYSLQPQYDLPLTEVVALLHKYGFSAVSPLWSPDLDMEALAEVVHQHGMTVQSLHAPHKGVALLWTPDSPLAPEICKSFLATVDACAEFNVPIMVLHTWHGFDYTFCPESLDFRLYDRIVAYAGRKGVRIALENLEGEEFLCALMDRYRDEPHVGYCWDSGHENCYPHKTDFLATFGDRLIMTHLNDNFGLRDSAIGPTGKDDLHFLPYDGNLDWDHAISRLRNASRQEILNFEIKIRSASDAGADLPYLHLSLESFIEKAAARAGKIAEKYGKIINEA